MEKDRSKVFMMCGPAGSGKSHLAGKFERAGMVRLSFDEESYRRGLLTHPLPDNIQNEIRMELDRRLLDLIEEGRDVVLDYSFWAREMRGRYMDLLRAHGIEPIIFYVRCPKEVAVERINERNGKDANDIMLTPGTAEVYYDGFQVPTEDEGIIVSVEGI